MNHSLLEVGSSSLTSRVLALQCAAPAWRVMSLITRSLDTLTLAPFPLLRWGCPLPFLLSFFLLSSPLGLFFSSVQVIPQTYSLLWLQFPNFISSCLLPLPCNRSLTDTGWRPTSYQQQQPVAESTGDGVEQPAGVSVVNRHEYGPVHISIRCQRRGRDTAAQFGRWETQGKHLEGDADKRTPAFTVMCKALKIIAYI